MRKFAFDVLRRLAFNLFSAHTRWKFKWAHLVRVFHSKLTLVLLISCVKLVIASGLCALISSYLVDCIYLLFILPVWKCPGR